MVCSGKSALMAICQGMNTTAGSYSLLNSVVPNDAGVVKRLRKAGAIILGGCLDNVDHYKTSNMHRCRQGKPIRVGALSWKTCLWMVRTWRTMHRRVLPKRRPLWLVGWFCRCRIYRPGCCYTWVCRQSTFQVVGL